MQRSDVLIVGGGPAGSSCAWGLRAAGLEATIIDRARFPRDKICAGWITPQVTAALKLDLEDYTSGGRVLQPIGGFRVGVLGARAIELDFDETVSHGIRRCEFDDYLLRRSGARLELGEGVRRIERGGAGWLVDTETTPGSTSFSRSAAASPTRGTLAWTPPGASTGLTWTTMSSGSPIT